MWLLRVVFIQACVFLGSSQLKPKPYVVYKICTSLIYYSLESTSSLMPHLSRWNGELQVNRQQYSDDSYWTEVLVMFYYHWHISSHLSDTITHLGAPTSSATPCQSSSNVTVYLSVTVKSNLLQYCMFLSICILQPAITSVQSARSWMLIDIQGEITPLIEWISDGMNESVCLFVQSVQGLLTIAVARQVPTPWLHVC